MRTLKTILITGTVILLALLTACSQKPGEIHYGSDECAFCKMMISDNRFASQIVKDTGKSIKFDAIECMAIYGGDHKSELETAKLWVSDFSKPGNWLEVKDAVIIKSNVINSPMGASLLAVGSSESARKHLEDYPGEKVAWQRIVK